MLHAKTARHQPHEFSLVVGGPLYRIYLRTRLADAPLGLVQRRLLAFVLITWVPLWVLSMGSHDTRVSVTLLRDIGAHARLLIALPLLIAAESIAHQRLSCVVRQFIDRGLVAPADLRRFAIVAPLVPLVLTMVPFDAVVDRAINMFI